MTVATDIAALKARCTTLERRVTAVEARNTKQSQAILDLQSRIKALEALKAHSLTISIASPEEHN